MESYNQNIRGPIISSSSPFSLRANLLLIRGGNDNRGGSSSGLESVEHSLEAHEVDPIARSSTDNEALEPPILLAQALAFALQLGDTVLEALGSLLHRGFALLFLCAESRRCGCVPPPLVLRSREGRQLSCYGLRLVIVPGGGRLGRLRDLLLLRVSVGSVGIGTGCGGSSSRGLLAFCWGRGHAGGSRGRSLWDWGRQCERRVDREDAGVGTAAGRRPRRRFLASTDRERWER